MKHNTLVTRYDEFKRKEKEENNGDTEYSLSFVNYYFRYVNNKVSSVDDFSYFESNECKETFQAFLKIAFKNRARAASKIENINNLISFFEWCLNQNDQNQSICDNLKFMIDRLEQKCEDYKEIDKVIKIFFFFGIK